MAKIAIQTHSKIIKLGFEKILKDYEIYDYYELKKSLINIDLLLFEEEELEKEKIKKIKILTKDELPLNNDFSIISLYANKDEILDSVDKTLRGYIYIEEKLKSKKAQRNKNHKILKELSRREKYLIEEIIKGRSNKEISKKIYISEKTVKNNLTELYKKLEVSGRRELVIKYKNIYKFD